MGRNIWQSDWPVAMIKAVRAIVHRNAETKEAYGIFLKEKEKDRSVQREPQRVVKTLSRSPTFD